MINNIIHLNKRTFGEYRESLISMIKQYYPEILNDFTDSSVGSILIDLNAAVSDNLSFNTDRSFQETQIDYAQQKESILQLARKLLTNIPNKRPSVTIVELSVNVPVKGDKPDEDYLPVLMPGAQIIGGGTTFETMDIVDWKSAYSTMGNPNRSIIPNTDSNGIIVNYTIKKREVVFNGRTNIFRKTIKDVDVKQFYKLTLPDPDIIEINDVILINPSDFIDTPTETDYKNLDFRYHEVDYLAQQKVFIDDPNKIQENITNNIKSGRWVEVTKKFIKEFDVNGFCSLTFGSGDMEQDAFKNGFLKNGITNRDFLDNYLKNTALGEMLRKDAILFVRYRTGGGINTNVGVDTLRDMGQHIIKVNGVQQNLNNLVKNSLRVTNIIPAIGGNDGLSIEELRHLIKYNYSSQYRCVTLSDYLVKTMMISGRYGSPFKVNTFKENNKVIVSIINIDNNLKLNNTSNILMKENIAEYLSNYRMINDYVEIRDGRIFNIGVDIFLYVKDGDENRIVNDVIKKINDYFSIYERNMNEDIMLTDLFNQITNVVGVYNILDVKFFNKVGDNYSINPIEQEIVDENTGEIKIVNNTIYSTEDSMFEIKFPEKDIRVFLKKKIN